MQRVLSRDLWKTIRAHAQRARCRRAVIAYVTQDLIGFRKGDTLVVDASTYAVCNGETSAKLSLTTVLAIIGAVSGGAGIAAFGGAIGVPLAVLLGLVGYFVGNEIDAKGLVRRLKESLTGSNEPTLALAQTTEDIEELTELITTLLARCEQDEQLVRALQEKTLTLERQNGELRANISVVSLRCDKAESVAREAQDRTALIQQELSDLRGSVPLLQSQFTSLKQQTKYLIWSGATVGAIMAIALFWLSVRK